MHDVITKKLYLSGRVQGVGMRYYINRTATRMGVMGHVKNMYNGQVECLCQGDSSTLTRFIATIKAGAPGHIERIIEEDIPNHRELHKFTIRLF